MKRAINLLFPLFLLNSCLALRIRHEYHEKLESAAQLDHTACKYYAKGNLYPNSQKLFVTAAITDITIGVSLGILNPWIGGGYFLLGLGVLGERLSPFTSMIWCGSPSNPTEPPYDFFYVFDSAHFYSCFNGSCKDHYGCALIPQRKQAILWYFVIVNGIDFCLNDKCVSPQEYINNHYEGIKNETPLIPSSLHVSEVDDPTEKMCIYSLRIAGGINSLKKEMELYKKQNVR